MDLDINECELEKKKLISLITKNEFVINTRCHCRFLTVATISLETRRGCVCVCVCGGGGGGGAYFK